MTELILSAACIAIALAWAELREWLPWIAKRVVVSAISRLPSHLRSRMHEELVAEVEAIPGKISPLAFACSVWWGFTRASFFAWLNVRAPHYALRLTDVALVSLFLLESAPVLLLAFTVTSFSSGQWRFRRIRRLGRNQKPFELLQFEIRDARTGKVTRCGRAVYRLRLNELPMLLNVLRGDMSLVGPPPARDSQALSTGSMIRPGIAWTLSTFPTRVDGFGESVGATLRIYFLVLWATVRAVLAR